MLDISYLDDKGTHLTGETKNDDTNVLPNEIEMKINGKLKHTMKAMRSKFVESISFPSGRVLRYEKL